MFQFPKFGKADKLTGYAFRRECKKQGRTALYTILSLVPNVRNKIKLCYLKTDCDKLEGEGITKGINKMKVLITPKWTFSPSTNNRDCSILGFTPYELNNGMTASAWLAQYHKETGMEVEENKKPLNLLRCALKVADLIERYTGKASEKVKRVLSDEKALATVNETENAQAEVTGLNAKARSILRTTERAKLVGTPQEKLTGLQSACDAIIEEVKKARARLKTARENEERESMRITAEIYPHFFITGNKTSIYEEKPDNNK